MDQPRPPTDNTALVPAKALHPIVSRNLRRFSAVQWNLLAAGILDPATAAMLADLCTEMLQSICTFILSFLTPSIEESFHKKKPARKIKSTLQNLNTNVGDVLSESFAEVLGVEPVKCDSAAQLTALVDKEVSEKVESIVSEALRNSVLPEEPAVVVSSTVSSIGFLGQMVSYVSKCLRRCLNKVKFQWLGECWHPKVNSPEKVSETPAPQAPETPEVKEPEHCDSPLSVKSKISVHSATEAVTNILLKWSSENQEKKKSPLSDVSLDAQDAASDIVKVIIDDLRYENFENVAACSQTTSPPGQHFNLWPILYRVKDFFFSQDEFLESLPVEEPKKDKVKFSSFAKKQYKKMMAELKKRLKAENPKYMVRLKKDTGSPQTPEPTGSFSRMGVNGTGSKVGAKAIKSDVDSLFEMLHQTKDPAARLSKSIEDIKASGELRKFSKELVDKMYCHLAAGLTDEMPIVSAGSCLSDSVIPELTRKREAAQSKFSPEVLYAMTEDAVERFLQKVLLWKDRQESDKRSHSEEVSSVLNDIVDVVTEMLSTSGEEDAIEPEPESPKANSEPEVTPQTPHLCEAEPSESVCVDMLNVGVDGHEVTSQRASPDRVSQPAPVTPHSPEGRGPSLGLIPEEAAQGQRTHTAQSPESSSVTEEMTNAFMTALFLRLLTKVPNITDVSGEVDVNGLTQDLSAMALKGNNTCDSQKKMKALNQTMTEDLHMVFDRPTELLRVATTSQDEFFDEVVVTLLQQRVQEPPSLPPKKKKSKVARFFSAVRKAFIRPFK